MTPYPTCPQNLHQWFSAEETRPLCNAVVPRSLQVASRSGSEEAGRGSKQQTLCSSETSNVACKEQGEH